MIELQHIYKSYDTNTLLEDVSVTWSARKIKIKGENGIGKSVLLKLVVGYSKPNKGRILYDEKEVGKDSDFMENAGVSISAPSFMPNWTGYENLVYLASIKKVCTKKRIRALLKEFDLYKDANKKCKTYSLGMLQKMRIIQALLDEPKYLILDEPFDALSSNAKLQAKNILQQYLDEDPSRMLLYTSHSEEDDIFADEIYCIDNQTLIRVK